MQVATFGTEGTKSAVLTACRGYRSEDFPDGIDVDQAQYMSSLIPQERGFLWPISDVINGNEEKDTIQQDHLHRHSHRRAAVAAGYGADRREQRRT